MKQKDQTENLFTVQTARELLRWLLTAMMHDPEHVCIPLAVTAAKTEYIVVPEGSDSPIYAVATGESIIFNGDKMAELPTKEQRWVLLHELLHEFLGHSPRMTILHKQFYQRASQRAMGWQQGNPVLEPDETTASWHDWKNSWEKGGITPQEWLNYVSSTYAETLRTIADMYVHAILGIIDRKREDIRRPSFVPNIPLEVLQTSLESAAKVVENLLLRQPFSPQMLQQNPGQGQGQDSDGMSGAMAPQQLQSGEATETSGTQKASQKTSQAQGSSGQAKSRAQASSQSGDTEESADSSGDSEAPQETDATTSSDSQRAGGRSVPRKSGRNLMPRRQMVKNTNQGEIWDLDSLVRALKNGQVPVLDPMEIDRNAQRNQKKPDEQQESAMAGDSRHLDIQSTHDQNVRALIQFLDSLGFREYGIVPGNLEEALGLHSAPPDAILKTLLQQGIAMQTDDGAPRPQVVRRLLPANVIMFQTEAMIPMLCIIRDTSGSMDSGTIERISSQIWTAVRGLNHFVVALIDADWDVQRAVVFTHNVELSVHTKLPGVEFISVTNPLQGEIKKFLSVARGRGGTSFVPAIDLAEKIAGLVWNPNFLILYFTDGEGEWPQKPPRGATVIWILPSQRKVPFGKVIAMPQLFKYK